MTLTLPDGILSGVPAPTRGRWQPQRAGITGLFHYDSQVFSFYRGRLLLRGNNGNGKSMALEVLLPFVLTADLDPSQLSTFGHRSRSMYTWLLGHDSTNRHTGARGYVWVEFGRVGPLGQPEYFTVGAGLEAVRTRETVTPWYFTTAARIGIDLTVGTPGGETPSRDAFLAELEQLAAQGMPGDVRTTKNHRAECNRVLFGLPDESYRSLLKALRQLRRPKLSDKLSQKALAEILRDSLPSLDRGLVSAIAKGYERLDRHQDDIKNIRAMIAGLRELDVAYQRYARACLWQRAHAITACQQALARASKKAQDSARERDRLTTKIDECQQKVATLTGGLNKLNGHLAGLRDSEFYTEGPQLQPLLDKAETLEGVAESARVRAENAASQAELDAESAAQAQAKTDAAGVDVQRRQVAVEQGAQLFTWLRDIYDALQRSLGDPDMPGSERPVAEMRSQLRQAVADVHARLQGLNRIAGQATDAAKAAEALAKEVEQSRIDLVSADEQVATARTQLRTARDEFIAAARAWMALSDQLVAAGVPWRDVESARMNGALTQWRNAAYRSRSRQITTLVQRFTGMADQPQQVAGQLHHGFRVQVERARQASADRDATHQDLGSARDEWLQELNDWVLTLTHLPVHGPALPARDIYAPQPWRDWITTAAASHRNHIAAVEQELQERQRSHHLQHHQCQAEWQRLADQREHLAAEAMVTPTAPATRLDSRQVRAGAPFYLLIDFVHDDLDPARKAGLEAALIGSGVADAWLNPDGLLLTADGVPLADTQLNATTEAVGQPLAAALRADADAARVAGVPVAAISNVLASIGLAEEAKDTRAHLAVGWDGSWRAGPLNGAYRQDATRLVGAASRERDRQARLAEFDRRIAELDRRLAAYAEDEQRLTGEATALNAAKEQAGEEAAGLPGTGKVEYAAQRAHDADDAAQKALEQASLLQRDLHAAIARLHLSRSEDLAAVVAAAPVSELRLPDPLGNLPTPADLALLDHYVQTSAAALSDIGRISQEALSALDAAATTAQEQYDAFPDTESLNRHEQAASQAEHAQVTARDQFTRRGTKHQAALTASAEKQSILNAALTQSDLTEWSTRLGDLPPRVNSWTDTAEDWLRTIADYRTAAEISRDTAHRSGSSAALASRESSQAASDRGRAAEAREHYTTLADRIGIGYTSLMAEMAEAQTQISEAQEAIAQNQQTLVALAAQQGAAQNRATTDANAYTDISGALPELAAKLWVAVRADLPRAADWRLTTGPDDDGETETATAASQHIQELAGGDAVNRYGPHHNDDLVSAVFQLRHQAETSLGGRLTLIERYAADILVVEAARDSSTATLPSTIADLNNEVISLQTVLNTEEAKLLEQFLTDSIRREITGHIDAARKQVIAMSKVMQEHRTSAGYRFNLDWAPASDADVDNRVLDLLAADFDAAPSAKERLRQFFASRIANIRATKTGQTWEDLLQEMLDYRRWYQFQLQFAKGVNEFAELDNAAFDKLSGGEKSVALHLPLFAAAATHTVAATVRDTVDTDKPGCPRLILLDEVFAGVDEDMRGELFDLVTSLDMDLVATSEAETGMYAELDGIAIYHLIKSTGVPGVLAARSVWTGTDVLHLLDNDLERGA
ncbi:SbcC/MukB-like Walker B domain-containing protein [Micromonospora sp. NPDC005324]|uniref:SbcC/MukB-like Walker B domain-containing protein n=1 Tax=Micromonospora sp. NPDC005324 TaxID=3157033 RepID=UPI0033B98536